MKSSQDGFLVPFTQFLVDGRPYMFTFSILKLVSEHLSSWKKWPVLKAVIGIVELPWIYVSVAFLESLRAELQNNLPIFIKMTKGHKYI